MNQLSTVYIRSTGNKGPAVLGVAVTFLVATWIAVGLRFYSRVVISRTVGGDDWVMLAALILFTIYDGLVLSAVSNGTGQHLENLNLASVQTAVAASMFAELAYVLATTVARVSIAVFLLRVAVERCHRRILLVTSFATVAFNIFLLFFALLQCAPVSYYWTRITQPLGGHCIPIQQSVDATFTGSAISATADLIYASIPAVMLWDAPLQKRAKLALAVLLGMGAASGIAVIVRMGYINEMKDADYLYQTANLEIWSVTEPGLGITAGSLATLRPLFRKLQIKWRTRNSLDPIHTTEAGHWEIPNVDQDPPQSSSLELGVTKSQSVLRYDNDDWLAPRTGERQIEKDDEHE